MERLGKGNMEGLLLIGPQLSARSHPDGDLADLTGGRPVEDIYELGGLLPEGAAALKALRIFSTEVV